MNTPNTHSLPDNVECPHGIEPRDACIPSARPESLLERLERGTAEAERAAGIVRLPAHLVYPLPYEIRSQMRPELLKWGD